MRDDRGIVFDTASSARRIVTLSPHLAELAFAAGAGSRVVAVASYSDYPPQASRLPQVGDGARIDVERVLALQPDLVLGWRSGNPAGDLRRLERVGLRVVITDAAKISDIARVLRLIGELAGTRDDAAAAASKLEVDLAALRARYASRSQIPVFYEVWHRPLLTVNGAHLISDVVALCGGRNVFAGAAALTPGVSFESIVAAKPRVVLGGSSAASPQEFRALWQRAPIAALRRLPVRYVPPDLIQRATPRIVEGASVICTHLDAIRRSGL